MSAAGNGWQQNQILYKGECLFLSNVPYRDYDISSFLYNQVDSSQLFKFHAAYGALLKVSMTTLRKRDKKREKLHSEQAARRKKRMTEPIQIDGPKRGNGRRKRQRQLKALDKQRESQQKFKEREEARRKTEGTL